MKTWGFEKRMATHNARDGFVSKRSGAEESCLIRGWGVHGKHKVPLCTRASVDVDSFAGQAMLHECRCSTRQRCASHGLSEFFCGRMGSCRCDFEMDHSRVVTVMGVCLKGGSGCSKECKFCWELSERRCGQRSFDVGAV